MSTFEQFRKTQFDAAIAKNRNTKEHLFLVVRDFGEGHEPVESLVRGDVVSAFFADPDYSKVEYFGPNGKQADAATKAAEKAPKPAKPPIDTVKPEEVNK